MYMHTYTYVCVCVLNNVYLGSRLSLQVSKVKLPSTTVAISQLLTIEEE